MPAAKLSQLQFKTLVNQYDNMQEQVEFIQKGKKALIQSHGITPQAFYHRRKFLEL